MEADLVDWVGSQQSKKKLRDGDLVSNLRYSVLMSSLWELHVGMVQKRFTRQALTASQPANLRGAALKAAPLLSTSVLDC